MVKNKVLGIVCTACLVFIALFSLLKHLNPDLLTLLSALFFTCVFSFILEGAFLLISKIRNRNIGNSAFVNLGLAALGTSLFSGISAFGASLLWQDIFLKQVQLSSAYTCSGISVIIVMFFSLICEILFLMNERELDNKVVKSLDNELMHAEMKILKNELDPHFVYNSLMPLYYLIKNDVSKAESFAYKLMQVYQHFLQKQRNDFITLEEELEFINNYYYLLQIRFKDAVKLKINVRPETLGLQVIPFSLQLLIENAIKHNRFDNTIPLEINIETEGSFVIVSNTFRPPQMEAKTSKVGLNNLRTRYKVLSHRTISVLKNKDFFIVKIPLLRNVSKYDVSSYNRG